MKYEPSRGGHAPGHLRERFEVLAEDMLSSDGPSPELVKLAGRMWNCTDVMPRFLCEVLDMTQGSTYGQGARRIRD